MARQNKPISRTQYISFNRWAEFEYFERKNKSDQTYNLITATSL